MSANQDPGRSVRGREPRVLDRRPVGRKIVPCVARAWLVSLIVAGFGVEGASAQATGLPTFFAPTREFRSTELGVTLSRPGGDATCVEGRLGAALNRADLAFRVGYGDRGRNAGNEFLAGVEARVPVLGHSRTFPLDGAFIFGVGRSFVDRGGQTYVPLGLSLGRRLVLDGSAFELTPYVQPTVIFESSSLFVLGLGLNVRLRGIPDVRVNWAEGDLGGFSVSLFWAH